MSYRGKIVKFSTLVHMGTKMNSLDFEVKSSKVKVSTRPNVVRNPLLRRLCHHRTLSNDSMYRVVLQLLAK